MSNPPRILFVCLGNICRSPLAEAALRRLAKEAALEVHVESAGTGGWHVGEPPDLRAQAVARRQGCDISGLRGRQVMPDDFRRFDRIFALDSDNLARLRQIAPADGTANVGLLLDLIPGRAGQGVHDPYYGADAGFEETWQDVETAARAIVAELTRQTAA
jgi:protein-tyrosine phosphatase